MASSYYDESTKTITNGTVADAADVNNVNVAVDTAFQDVETDLTDASAGAIANKEYAEEWANKAEDSLVSAAAGGDQVDDYSALHWANKASDDAASTAADVVSTNADVVSTNADVVSCADSADKLPAAEASKAGALIVQNTDDSNFDLLTSQGDSGQVLTSAGADATPSFQDLPLLQNLLTNSGFEIWSNSTTKEVGAQISISGIASGVCTTSDTQDLVVGKLFEFYSGTTTGVYEVTAVVTDTTFTLNDTSITEASAHTGYEMTPGCIAANNLAMDGWSKNNTTLDVLRQHNDSALTKDGSFYSLKILKGSDAVEAVVWPTLAMSTEEVFTSKFLGRVCTFGAWVYDSTASNTRLRISGSTNAYSSYHTGTPGWEWLEITHTIPTNTTQLRAMIQAEASTSDVSYISQPMLVFGSSIGEGNYSKPFGEIIELEAPISSNAFGAALSDDSEDVNIEASSSGKIGKGVASVSMVIKARDSDTATGTPYLEIRDLSDNFPILRASCTFADAAGRDDVFSYASGEVPLNSAGSYEGTYLASGAGTLDAYAYYYRIKLK